METYVIPDFGRVRGEGWITSDDLRDAYLVLSPKVSVRGPLGPVRELKRLRVKE